jgi:hypothetical protein
MTSWPIYMNTFENSPGAVTVFNATRENLIHKIGSRTYYRGICVALIHAWRDYCLARGVAHACIPNTEDAFPDTFRIIKDILKTTSIARGTYIWPLGRAGYHRRLKLLDTIIASREFYMDTRVKATFHKDGVKIHYAGQDDVFYGASK